jgi:WhiB family redox-sensing transcriptional regulator
MADIRRLPAPLIDHWEWQLDAACRGMDSDIFFHPKAERDVARERRITRAKAICQSCPAIRECLAHALRMREPYGIWGGLSEGERAALLGVASLRYPARIKEVGTARTAAGEATGSA